jgi:DNA invertase Pin-like site-specific DNA recombinase
MIRERQREGIAVAKANGVYKGGKSKLTEERAAALRQRIAAGEKKAVVAREFGINRETLYQYLAKA